MKKRRKKNSFQKKLLIICIITGIATLILRILNRQLQIPELSELAGYAATAFIVSLIIIAGIWVVKYVNKNA